MFVRGGEAWTCICPSERSRETDIDLTVILDRRRFSILICEEVGYEETKNGHRSTVGKVAVVREFGTRNGEYRFRMNHRPPHESVRATALAHESATARLRYWQ
jgi:hypothetical protein